MLFIVGTPIGNLDDLSLRQAKTLAQSDVILAEDTRSAQILLNAIAKRFIFQVSRSAKIISYYKEKEFEKLPEVLAMLRKNKQVSLISQSGMPLISDPGWLLIKSVIKEELPYTVIPGPTAAITALIYSGFNPNPPAGGFMFLGFLPKKESELLRSIERIKRINEIDKEMVFVFYESPQRINKTLELLDRNAPNVDVVICREMTKKFEEIVRGKPKELMKRNYKGEITVVINC